MTSEGKVSARHVLSLRQDTVPRSLVLVEESTLKLVIFSIQNELFAIAGTHIREILPYTAIHFVPGCPAALEGVINVRGDITSVIRLGGLLGLNKTPITRHSSILLGVGGGMISGLLIDRMLDVLDTPQSAIRPPATTLPSHLQTFVSGIYRHCDQAVTVLDLELLFQEYLRGLG
ncbi:Chemotaxis protein CheW [Gammaproteobacteria bacterium]